MITEKEINECQLSTTKKDFYQIWNELLDTAGKLSSRWDPASTNESDPGIVLLKVATALVDKINFEIDTNTLENFMPSAAQEESMRKLCDMMGYSIKYYQSATTDVQVAYNTAKTEIPVGLNIKIDKFTNIKDANDSINYVTTNEALITRDNTSKIISCIEGELVECETDDNNIISINQLDDNRRYYLPESQIAENGIFITNINDSVEEEWEKTYNLNTSVAGKKVYKFGYNSLKGLPYVQFPEDIAMLIEDGLKIKYIRTSGANGNISADTLSKLQKPASWSGLSEDDSSKDYYQETNYIVKNYASTGTGKNIESINDAYNNYKKIIGTFDTLVTCRDYMNAIYNMSLDGNTPLVSNIIVSDINSDVNRAFTICTFDKSGIAYKNTSLNISNFTTVEKESELPKAEEEKFIDDSYYYVSTTKKFYKCSRERDGGEYTYRWVETSNNGVSCFDLMLYPFTTVRGLNTKLEYVKSFKYNDEDVPMIKEELEANKTISHNFRLPDNSDVICIKNYLKLKARITTIRKVNVQEQLSILANVYSKIYENFNMHKIDFGEEIPYDTILSVIENADTRIKNISLDEPELQTKYCMKDGTEFDAPVDGSTALDLTGIKIHNKLVLNNVISGRIPLFNYDENFKPSYEEINYPSEAEYASIYPTDNNEIEFIEPKFTIEANMPNVKLNDNEVIQFRLQNMKTEKTYPAYVNYFIHLNSKDSVPAIGATMFKLAEFLNQNENTDETEKHINWEIAANDSRFTMKGATVEEPLDWAGWTTKYIKIFEKNTKNRYVITSDTTPEDGKAYYHLSVDKDGKNTPSTWKGWIIDQNAAYKEANKYAKISGLYSQLPADYTRNVGKFVDDNHCKYRELSELTTIKESADSNFNIWFVPHTFIDTDTTNTPHHTKDGLGQNAIFEGIKSGTEYELKDDEYLLINYTSSESTGENEVKTVINEVFNNHEIIKPNFDLVDSESWRTAHSYSKTSGFDFTGKVTEQPAGMFTLGTNEQIELRKFVEVELNEASTNLYWIRNDEDALATTNGRVVFKFDEDFEENDNGPDEKDGKKGYYLSYTLKDGEYVFYTSKDKIDLAYYGSGTKIHKEIDTPEIFKYKQDTFVSADDISSRGLNAGIAWRTYNFSSTKTTNTRKLTLKEYKYVNLTKDDILENVIYFADDTNNSGENNNSQDITNVWTKIKNASYNIGNGTEQLGEVSFSTYNVFWEIRSKLELNVGPNSVQELHNIGDKVFDEINLYLRKSSHQPIAKPVNIRNKKINNEYINVAFKTNKIIQNSTADKLSVVNKKFDESGQLLEDIGDLQLKLFKNSAVKDINDNTVNIGNFGNGNFTKINFVNYKDSGTNAAITLNTNILDNRFGLIMFYYTKVSDGDAAYLKCDKPLTIYNNENYADLCTNGWWKDKKTATDKNELRQGINVVKVAESCVIEIHSDSKYEDALVFSNLDIIYDDGSSKQPTKLSTVNPKLKYFYMNASPAEQTPVNIRTQILKDISHLDNNLDFYYNTIISNNTIVDLNSEDETDNMLNPRILYDYNNKNNKFVISEIDADYLPTGITIAKTSRL